MSAVAKKKLTEAEYLAIERAAEHRSEFYNGEMFAMAGAKYPHNRIKDNLAMQIGAQLAGGPCFPLISDMRVKVEKTGLLTYPDILIVCGEPQFPDAETTDVLVNPSVIVEVLSPSPERYDRGPKFRKYQSIETLKEIVLVSQDEPVIERFVRQSADSWEFTNTAGLENEFAFGTVPVRTPMAAIYAGITFPEPSGP